MLKVFVQKSHNSCRNLLNWLDDQGLEYEKRYIDKNPLTVEELLSIIRFTENGFEDILSYRVLNNQWKLTEKEIDAFTVKELAALMVKYPVLIKKPIVIRGDKLVIGYNKTLVYTLIPKDLRFRQRMEIYSLSINY